MTEKRSKPEIDDVGDPLVSRSYREIASEKVPAELDQAILRQAGQNVGKQYSKSVIWLRPMAWAATIGLSLAIVIELSSVPMSSSDMMYAPAEMPVSPAVEEAEILEEITIDADRQVEPARKESLQMEQRARKSIDSEGRISLDDISQFGKVKAPAQQDMPALDFQGESPAAHSPLAKSQLIESQLIASPADQNPLPASSASRALPALVVEAPELKNELAITDELRRDADMNAPGSFQSTAVVGALAASQSGAFEADMPAPCDAQTRESAGTWLECIETLDKAGFGELADLQREQLLEAFPDFELPE